jgi:hypothetical protein
MLYLMWWVVKIVEELNIEQFDNIYQFARQKKCLFPNPKKELRLTDDGCSSFCV